MSNNEQQGGGQGNTATDMAWMIAGFFAVILTLWFVFKQEILTALFTVKYAEMWLISQFDASGTTIMHWIANGKYEIAGMTGSEIIQFMDAVGDYYKFPIAIILFTMAAYLFIKHPSANFRKTFNMETLLQQESKIWPHITPIVGKNLLEQDISKGEWAMAESPMEFSIKHNILIPPKRDPRRPSAPMVATIDRDKANKIFKAQMGPRMVSVDMLPIHMKALAGAFAARVFEERKAPAKLLGQISFSSANVKKINFSGAQELWNRYKNEKIIGRILSNHAFVLTFMAAMLEISRIDGVLASADFLWLKPLDRPLWYMLNNVGRQTAFPEIAGPFAHWRAEKAIGRKINTPMIDEATKALAKAIENVIYTGDKEPWEL